MCCIDVCGHDRKLQNELSERIEQKGLGNFGALQN
jgi:hypothetical protein